MMAKSVSVQNLENLVKQMVNGALEDNEQLIKFHRMIYEEWYFKKLSEARDTKCEAIETKQPQIRDQNTVSTTDGYRILRRFKYKRRNGRSSTAINPITHTTVKNPSNVPRGNNFSAGEEEWNQDSGTADEIIESGIVVSNDSVKDKVSRSLAFGKRFNPATSRNSTYLDTPFQEFDQIGDRKVIELWSSSVKRSETKDSLGEKKPTFKETRLRGCDAAFYAGNGSAKKQENPLNLSFEAWKRMKTIAYRQVLASKEKKKQQLLIANLANIKQKKMTEQEQARKKQQRSLMLSKKRLDAVKRGNVVIPRRNRSKEKPIVAEGGVNDGPRKRTDTKLDKRRTTRTRTRKPNHVNADRTDKTNWMQYMEGAAFDSWLHQLNWVLHEKYLRERRHLVRSFYCQPVYYGGTA